MFQLQLQLWGRYSRTFSTAKNFIIDIKDRGSIQVIQDIQVFDFTGKKETSNVSKLRVTRTNNAFRELAAFEEVASLKMSLCIPRQQQQR